MNLTEALKTEAGRRAINEAVARLDGWESRIERWNKCEQVVWEKFYTTKAGQRVVEQKQYENPPNYLESWALTGPLPLPPFFGTFRGEDEVTVYWIENIPNSVHVTARTEPEARVLAFLIHNDVTEVEAEDE